MTHFLTMPATERRIPRVDYTGTVHADTLEQLGERAWEACSELYGDNAFIIEALYVRTSVSTVGGTATRLA